MVNKRKMVQIPEQAHKLLMELCNNTGLYVGQIISRALIMFSESQEYSSLVLFDTEKENKNK